VKTLGLTAKATDGLLLPTFPLFLFGLLLLSIAVGSQLIAHGVEGIEYCSKDN